LGNGKKKNGTVSISTTRGGLYDVSCALGGAIPEKALGQRSELMAGGDYIKRKTIH
jgi:hypothetical protein